MANGGAVKLQRVLEVSNLLATDRRENMVSSQRCSDVFCQEASGLQCRGIHIDLYLTLLAAVRQWNDCARHGDQRCSYPGQTGSAQTDLPPTKPMAKSILWRRRS